MLCTLSDKCVLLGFHKTRSKDLSIVFTKMLLYGCELLTSYRRSMTLRLKDPLIQVEREFGREK